MPSVTEHTPKKDHGGRSLIFNCVCLDCLCYNGTRKTDELCCECLGSNHPGDPRPYKPVTKVNPSESN